MAWTTRWTARWLTPEYDDGLLLLLGSAAPAAELLIADDGSLQSSEQKTRSANFSPRRFLHHLWQCHFFIGQEELPLLFTNVARSSHSSKLIKAIDN